MADHNQVKITVRWYRGKTKTISVDEDCAEIVEWFNEIGAHTFCSCQDINGTGMFMIGVRHGTSRGALEQAKTVLYNCFPHKYVWAVLNDTFDVLFYVGRRIRCVYTNVCRRDAGLLDDVMKAVPAVIPESRHKKEK